jgi:hypothetical protein
MYQQVTLATMQARLADRYEGVPFWSADEGRRALNEGLRIWNAATGMWRSTILLPTIPNDPYVFVPSSIVRGTRLTWNDLPLEFCSMADLEYGFSNWRLTTTATPGAPERPIYWAPVSLNLLALYPADAYSSVNGTHALQVNGVANTPILLDPLDYIDLGQELFDVLLGYALHVLAFKIGGQTLTDSYPKWRDFLKAAAQENHQFAASAYYRKLMGLDWQRSLMPPEKAVATIVEDAAPQGGG